jgi:hypothetical protein
MFEIQVLDTHGQWRNDLASDHTEDNRFATVADAEAAMNDLVANGDPRDGWGAEWRVVEAVETLYRQTQEPGDFMGALATIADAIGGGVWHSGGGIYGVLVQRPDWECFFGFADDVLGWDIGTPDGDWIGGGITELTIDQTDAVIARCRVALDTKETQHIYSRIFYR